MGLLAILLSITLYIAVFIDSSDANFFTSVRSLFGQTTIVAAFFTMNLGLLMLQSRFPTANKISVVAQFVLLILVPAFITSLQASKADAILARNLGYLAVK